MRWLRSVLRSIGRRIGLYDDGITEIENRRAVRDEHVTRMWPDNLRKKVTKA